MEGETIIYTDVTQGQKAKVARILLGKRQVDIASAAVVTVQEVSRLEKDAFVMPSRKKRILKALGLLEEDGNEANS
jgi:transcriptional regulator with XRE-family HTH domain